MGNVLCVRSSSSLLDEVQERHVRFVRAVLQIKLLDRHSALLLKRLDHANNNQRHAARYQLRMKLSVIQSVADMYLEYACRQLDRIYDIASSRVSSRTAVRQMPANLLQFYQGVEEEDEEDSYDAEEDSEEEEEEDY